MESTDESVQNRELQNAVERAATFCKNQLIEVENLPQRLREASAEPTTNSNCSVFSLPTGQDLDSLALPSLETVQRNYIHQVLTATQGNKRKAAELLGITRRTLYRWLETSS